MSEEQTQEELDEATKKTRVDSKGKKTKRGSNVNRVLS